MYHHGNNIGLIWHRQLKLISTTTRFLQELPLFFFFSFVGGGFGNTSFVEQERRFPQFLCPLSSQLFHFGYARPGACSFLISNDELRQKPLQKFFY